MVTSAMPAIYKGPWGREQAGLNVNRMAKSQENGHVFKPYKRQ